jgi:hypothetical protein
MNGKSVWFSMVETEDGKRLQASVMEAPFKVKTTPRDLTFGLLNDDITAPTDFANQGDTIRKALMEHPEIASVLTALDKAPTAEHWNLLFGVSSPLGESVRWEILRNAADYVSVSTARRLFRVAADPSSPALGIRNFPDVLRFVAVLSPAGVDSTDEFDALIAAVEKGREAGLKVDLVLYVGQRELIQRAPAWATCKLMPSETADLQDELKARLPHILHFFCHGQSDLPQALQFATVAEQRLLVPKESVVDQRDEVPEGSVLVSMDRIVEARILESTWLVVFNCCDGGRPGKALGSMAYRAVAESGVPVAIGMGSPLPAGAAPLFSGALHRKVLKMLAGVFPGVDQGAVEVDFGEAIAEGRRALYDAINKTNIPFSCWTLPIIYLHRKPFNVQKVVPPQVAAAPPPVPPAAPPTAAPPAAPPPAPPAAPPAAAPPAAPPPVAAATPVVPLIIIKRIQTIAGMLQAMPSTTPRAVRQQMVALFDEEPYVPPAMRCDENGAFPLAGRTA